MKKSLVAASAASLALAAMPALGAFAAVQGSVTDTVKITINSACSVGTGADSQTGTGETYETTMANNATYIWSAETGSDAPGGTLKVSCNSASGWNIKAIGATTGTDKTVMKPTNIDASNAIATGTAGDNSYWAMKVGGSLVDETFGTAWHVIPATATKIAGGTAAVSEGSVALSYKVHTSATQAADTYIGNVTYTIAAGTN